MSERPGLRAPTTVRGIAAWMVALYHPVERPAQRRINAPHRHARPRARGKTGPERPFFDDGASAKRSHYGARPGICRLPRAA